MCIGIYGVRVCMYICTEDRWFCLCSPRGRCCLSRRHYTILHLCPGWWMLGPLHTGDPRTSEYPVAYILQSASSPASVVYSHLARRRVDGRDRGCLHDTPRPMMFPPSVLTISSNLHRHARFPGTEASDENHRGCIQFSSQFEVIRGN